MITATSLQFLRTSITSYEGRTLPIFAVFDETSKKNIGLAEENLLSLSYGRVIRKNIDTVDGLLPASFETYQVVEQGQFVLRLTDMQNDQKSLRTGLVPERGIITSAYCALAPKQEFRKSTSFLEYYLHALDVSKFLYSLGGGVRQTLKFDDIKHVPVLIPSEAQQDQIVRFLDEHTAKIDQLVEKYQYMLGLLALQHDAWMHHAFTTFTAERNEPVKRVLRKMNRTPIEGSGVITAYRDGEVTLRANRREDGYTFSDTEEGYQGIQVGDLVFHGLDGFAGAVGISDSDGQSTPVYHVCQLLNQQDDLKFIALYLRYLGLSGFLSTLAPSVRQRSVDFRNWQTFARIPLSLPTLKEQSKIVDRADNFSKSLREEQQTIQRAIDLALERRSALVTAAVTGQIEV